MPATSFSGECLCAALVERARRLAFEVDDARSRSRPAAPGRGDSRRAARLLAPRVASVAWRSMRASDLLARGEHELRRRRAGCGSVVEPCRQHARARPRAASYARGPVARCPAAATGSGSNAGSPRLAAKRSVQLGGALPERAHQREVAAVHIDVRRVGAAAASVRRSARGSRACSPSRRPGSRRSPAAARASSSRPSSGTYSSAAGHRHAVAGSARRRSGSGRSRPPD